MDFEQATDEELGLYVASNAPDDCAHAHFTQLFERHKDVTWIFVRSRISQGAVADIHQETWRKAWDRAKNFREGTNYRAWILTIAERTLIDYRRKIGRRPAQPLPEGGEFEPAAEDRAEVIDQEQRVAIENCIEALGDRLAQVVRARLSGRNYDDIATDLETTKNAAYKLWFKAKDALQDCIKRNSI